MDCGIFAASKLGEKCDYFLKNSIDRHRLIFNNDRDLIEEIVLVHQKNQNWHVQLFVF